MFDSNTGRKQEIVDLRRSSIRLSDASLKRITSLTPEMNWFDSLSPRDEQDIEQDAKNAIRSFLEKLGVSTQPAQVELTAGAHHGLYCTLASICEPKGVVICETLAYPGLKRIAASLGIHLIGAPCDDFGFIPDTLEGLLREQVPLCVFCTPTLQNPTGTTMTAERRIAIGDIVRKFNTPLIEDDVYRFLVPNAPPPIFNYAPDLTIYLTSFSKLAGNGMRIGAIIGSHTLLRKITRAVSATVLQVSPVLCAWLIRALEDGFLDLIAAEKKVEIARRCSLIAGTFRRFQHIPYSPHFWIHLRNGSSGLRAAATERGVLVADGADFTHNQSSGIRISVGAPVTSEALLRAMHVIDFLLTEGADTCAE